MREQVFVLSHAFAVVGCEQHEGVGEVTPELLEKRPDMLVEVGDLAVVLRNEIVRAS